MALLKTEDDDIYLYIVVVMRHMGTETVSSGSVETDGFAIILHRIH